MYLEDIMEQNGELSVPPVPGKLFREEWSQIAWDSEILQSFTELTNITNITLTLKVILKTQQ